MRNERYPDPNVLEIIVEGKISSIKELQKLQIANLKQRISSLEARIKKVKGHAQSDRTVHEKKRRLERLKAQLLRQEQDHAQGKIPLCFGTKRLFRKQFALKENQYSSHEEWKKDWQSARNESFFLNMRI